MRASESAAAANRLEIEAWILGALERRIGVPAGEIERDVELNVYGLDSVEAVILGAELADWLGADLDPAIVIEHPAVASLAQAIEEALASKSPPITGAT